MPSHNWQEVAASRMTRTLARQPRSAKTRAYLATLPKREKVVVKPEDYPLITRSVARHDALLQSIRDAQRYADWEQRGKPPSPTAPRRDRLRPRALTGQNPLRIRLYDAQKGICSLCEKPLGDPYLATFEHVVPRGLGGGNAGNRLLAHETCNNRKGCRLPTQREINMLAAVNRLIEDVGTSE